MKTGSKKVVTAWPNITGSETFIIVALRCTDSSRSAALAASICAAKKARSARALMKVPSTISPSVTARPSLRTVVPCSETSSMRSAASCSMTTDFSLP